ncbi:phenylalanine--tRNA ligase subunit beta [Paenibacillus aquistagni]|uniref:Phenylalanine--tRNA ligase beta subunit n=1 Tax=Paenibacillus aquistagni TaxID=1852522 RepID=A0A1X7LLE7_9BACL|nr:phenylalanine--tRNA ligase subunit beta [Paenibacillus aquistagni]SMG54625.1 phenylalanyl-tRNA synthetase beta subunit [Paenibacillus aquistagni]
MNVSYQWLSQYVDLSGVSAAELAEKITRSGIEIDHVEQRNKGLDHIVVGYVVEREKHPDADKLNVCKVDVGEGDYLQIVCGAPNVDAGQKVPVAKIGAVMPGGMKIKRAKLRGVESQGMICSAKELAMNDKLLPKEMQEGILVLPADLALGQPIAEVLGLNDEVLEFDLTPNRSDCLSMLGAAYEVGAILSRPVTLPSEEVEEAGAQASEHISVSIQAKEACSHYTARYIAGVKIAASPLWLQNRLLAAGVRPINNIVDITNFVMLEYGQPLHAFDADKLSNGRIEVRMANEGETLVTLDGQERKLDPSMLLITDGVKPVGLAGVMGGENSEVSESTVNILLESAKFDGGTIRKTARELGLRSEASLRFEKEVNSEAVVPALNRAAELMRTIAGGTVASGIVEEHTGSFERTVITLTVEKTNRLLGTSLTAEEIASILNRLGLAIVSSNADAFEVQAPGRRGDIKLDVDLIEEVARLYGYDNIPTTPIEGATTPGHLTKSQRIRRELRRLLADGGFHEAVTYSFTHPNDAAKFKTLVPGSKPVPLAMPMSEDRSVLRTSFIPSLLDAATYNRNRKMEDIALFEIGSLYVSDEEQAAALPEQKAVLTVLLTGRRQASQWNIKAEPVDFYDIKGVLDSIFSYLGLERQVEFRSERPLDFHPGRSACIYLKGQEGETLIGTVGQIHPELQMEKDLDDTYVAEILLEQVIALADLDIEYVSLPRFPAVERDVAVVLERSAEVGRLMDVIKEAAGELLEAVNVFDVYTGDRIAEDKKSVAISLVYLNRERTFTDEEITELHGKVVAALEAEGAELRK